MQKTKTISNPIGVTNIGDPFIFQGIDKNYYLYATSFTNGFNVWTSNDLVNWEPKGTCYCADNDSFGYCDFWAPEVIHYKGKYIMHYSARWKKNNSLRIGVAVADSPLGPFKDIGNKPMFDLGYAAIDGHVFIDNDDKKYLYFSKDCSENISKGNHESHLYVVMLSEDLLTIVSEPVFLMKAQQQWETLSGKEWTWNEGPCVIKKNNMYFLMYSANYFASKYYSLGYATANSPLGPFKKSEYNPLLKYVEGEISGPGHNSVFELNGDLICAYHVHTDYYKPSENRQLFLDRLYITEDKIIMNGPTIGSEI